MNFEPARHEPLQGAAWDAAAARAAIARIVADAEDAFVAGQGWRAHPQDTGNDDPKPLHGLYMGAAGVVWSLAYLQARGAAALRRDWRAHLGELGGMRRAGPSYLMGETAVWLLLHWLQPSEETRAELERCIARDAPHPTRELMWGTPGQMLAALFLYRRDGGQRWADAFVRLAGELQGQLLWSEKEQCHYWTQDMYGRQSTFIDTVHGFAGNAGVLIAGRELLADWPAWQDCIANTIQRTAEWEDGSVNWRAQLTSPTGAPKLVQYCHGAPGFVISLADTPDASLDALLLAAGETTWRAGPLRKGSNLCHGTGGNGYAFLKLFRRTGDAQWLERARAFAMHAIAQCDAARAEYGQGRYSLWTGDPGLAVYLLDCIEGTDRFPTLDVFFP